MSAAAGSTATVGEGQKLWTTLLLTDISSCRKVSLLLFCCRSMSAAAGLSATLLERVRSCVLTAAYCQHFCAFSCVKHMPCRGMSAAAGLSATAGESQKLWTTLLLGLADIILVLFCVVLFTCRGMSAAAGLSSTAGEGQKPQCGSACCCQPGAWPIPSANPDAIAVYCCCLQGHVCSHWLISHRWGGSEAVDHTTARLD